MEQELKHKGEKRKMNSKGKVKKSIKRGYVNGFNKAKNSFEEFNKDNFQEKINKLLNTKLNKKNKEKINSFHLHLDSTGYSIETIRSYLFQVIALSYYVKKDFVDITAIDLKKYFQKKKEEGLKQGTILNMQLILIVFFKWLYDERDREKIDVIKWIKLKRHVKVRQPDEIITKEDVYKMAQVSFHPRDVALFLSLFETGARCSEFLNLRIKDIEFDDYGAVAKIKTGKVKNV